MGELSETRQHTKEMVRLLKKGLNKVKASCKKGWKKAKHAADAWKKLPSPVKKTLTSESKKSLLP